VQAWLPVAGTTTGRLVEAALALFGAHGYDAVPVSAITTRAGVTTGPLYHHFKDKAGLYTLVRTDVEQRVKDRIDTAASLRPVHSPADLAAVLLPGYDYLVNARLTRLLAEDPPTGPGAPDVVELAIDELYPNLPPLGFLIAAAWRAALWRAGEGTAAALQARISLIQLLAGPTAS
jgi:AcrR family transcriptional regulator